MNAEKLLNFFSLAPDIFPDAAMLYLEHCMHFSINYMLQPEQINAFRCSDENNILDQHIFPEDSVVAVAVLRKEGYNY